jgi:hypothetical protein
MSGENPTPTVPKPPKPQLSAHLGGDPTKDAAAARKLHQGVLAGAVYAKMLLPQLRTMLPPALVESSLPYVQDMIDRFAPRDPLEEMLVLQAIVTHIRALHLAGMAAEQRGLDSIRTCNEYADRACNTLRRLTMALAEMRRPPRSDSFTAIKQTNIAGQQVVLNGGPAQTENSTNEQEPTHAEQSHATQPPSLSPDRGWTDRLAGLGAPGQAMGAVDRAADS